jgi:ABC-type Fe3+ transport system permease subunit
VHFDVCMSSTWGAWLNCIPKFLHTPCVPMQGARECAQNLQVFHNTLLWKVCLNTMWQAIGCMSKKQYCKTHLL